MRGEGVGPLRSFSGRLQGKRFSLEVPVSTGAEKKSRLGEKVDRDR